jgi:hypothetical protein
MSIEFRLTLMKALKTSNSHLFFQSIISISIGEEIALNAFKHTFQMHLNRIMFKGFNLLLDVEKMFLLWILMS